MCEKQNDTHEEIRKQGRKKQRSDEITISELLSAISDTEYPQYILDAVETVREWMNDMIRKPDDAPDEMDIFAAIFGQSFDDDTTGLENLFDRLRDIEKFADVIPTPKEPDGKPDTIIVSITPPDYESGLRSAIDYAAVFNRMNCRRVWIISDTFIFDEIVKFSPHVDALSEQGITMRFILVTPWGWVELPLSGAMSMKGQFLWRTNDDNKDTKPEELRRKRRKQ